MDKTVEELFVQYVKQIREDFPGYSKEEAYREVALAAIRSLREAREHRDRMFRAINRFRNLKMLKNLTRLRGTEEYGVLVDAWDAFKDRLEENGTDWQEVIQRFEENQ